MEIEQATAKENGVPGTGNLPPETLLSEAVSGDVDKLKAWTTGV